MNNVGQYENAGAHIGRIVDKKQAQYGDSFHRAAHVLAVLYPDGVTPEDYQNLLTVTRVIDKLFRIANGDQGDESAWRDIAGYGILGAVDKEGGQ